MSFPVTLAILFCASIWAGAQNALAGGGSFITLPSLMLTGMDARSANITSTIALFPAQVATGWTGREFVSGAAHLSFGLIAGISLVGGALGAVLLLVTPAAFFARLVPWLVLFATAVFAWGSFGPKKDSTRRLNRWGVMAAQFLISIYGGYFGGGIGFLMLAALSAAGLVIRTAGATKNVLAAIMNASAVAIFVFSPEVRWLQAAVCSAGAVGGGVLGGVMLMRVNERALRVAVIVLGVALTIGLFLRSP
ncbi:MAG TPA: sulfite exporter TauE/SafE family protein [Rhizomicrobium sp.]|nr:sulfite exporter TauE/SafE family protein [Rhizomicrobium sp.]